MDILSDRGLDLVDGRGVRALVIGRSLLPLRRSVSLRAGGLMLFG